jgi:hypothetical protein
MRAVSRPMWPANHNVLAAILKCYEKAAKEGVALDWECIDKARYKLDGGTDPTKG